ncbi:hypothetical protein [Bacillus toyonensis]|uniref:hypothetical protein n=1 Tax=Bacillus toyonensis TaxID=155322 RepID=UPI0035D984F4
MATIAFNNKPHIAILWLNKHSPKLIWNNYSERDSTVFTRLDEMVKEGFDFYFINNILILPDPVIKRSKLFDCTIDGLNIHALGEFIAFFHIAERLENEVIVADSLTFPEFDYLKKNIKMVRR